MKGVTMTFASLLMGKIKKRGHGNYECCTPFVPPTPQPISETLWHQSNIGLLVISNLAIGVGDNR